MSDPVASLSATKRTGKAAVAVMRPGHLRSLPYANIAQGLEESACALSGVVHGLLNVGVLVDVEHALDARSGEPLWHGQLNQEWRASSMTYMVGGRQYVAIASRLGFRVFALPE